MCIRDSTIFVREHNRLCDVMDADRSFSGLSVDEKFEKARAVRPLPRCIGVW